MNKLEIIKIDGIDKILLNGLMQNARMSINQLSKQVGISGAAVHQRIKKLEKFYSLYILYHIEFVLKD